jgi:uncharacterized protein with HEPN domain
MRDLDKVRIAGRLDDIRDAIRQIELLLAGRDLSSLAADRLAQAAFERFLEIVSEASRHVPGELKVLAPEIEWREIAAIGNQLRHGYQQIDIGILWDIHAKGQLRSLDDAVARLAATLEGPCA